jgi:hypothetical protein
MKTQISDLGQQQKAVDDEEPSPKAAAPESKFSDQDIEYIKSSIKNVEGDLASLKDKVDANKSEASDQASAIMKDVSKLQLDAQMA